MVGPVSSSPAQTGQNLNTQITQQAGQVEDTRAQRREPKEDQVQARQSPAAQTQESRAENSNQLQRTDASRLEQLSSNARGDDRRDDVSNDSTERGQIFDAVV